MKKLKLSEIYSKYYVGIYFIMLCIIAIFLIELFKDAKLNGFITTGKLPDNIKEIWYFFITFIFGGFYGANVITLLDKKKRVQGTLILIASLIIAYKYSYIVTLRPEIFGLGLLLTGIIGLITKTIKMEEEDDIKITNIKYYTAAQIASYLAILFVGLTYLNYLLGIQISNFNINNIVKYLILTVAFSFVFYKFMTYEIGSINIFIVGPGNSGKTVFLCGCCQVARDNNKLTGLPSGDLSKNIRKLYGGDWPPRNVGTRSDKFTYESGFLFVKDVVLCALDYEGQVLENKKVIVLDYLRRKIDNPELIPNQNADEKIRTAEQIADGIYSADKLIFIIDPENIRNECLFSWDEIPGNVSERLLNFLKEKFSIDWIGTSNIEKIDNGKTIKVSTEKNFLLLKLNDENTKLNLKIDDGRSEELIAKKENNTLNIYRNENYFDIYMDIISAFPKKYYLVITKADKIFETENWWTLDYEELKEKVLEETKSWDMAVTMIMPKIVIPTFFRVMNGKPFVMKNKFTIKGFDKILEIMGK